MLVDATSCLRVHPAAVRRLGEDLVVARPGPEQPVLRLSGSAPGLWTALSAGASVRDAAIAVAGDPAPDPELVAAAVAFARDLVAQGLAEPR